MRLTCPNCSAQYEVPDEVIPEEGRDVQCSNCEKTWFQPKHPDEAATGATDSPQDEVQAAPAEPDPAPAPETTAEPEPAPAAEAETDAPDQPAPPPEPDPEAEPESEPEPETPGTEPAASGNVDPAVASILKEEAARELELRAQEGGGLETQPDLALDSSPEPDPEQAIKELTASETSADAGQKDALPDVEAINSTLRGDDAAGQAAAEQPVPVKSGGGFLRGFALIVIVGIILLLLYSNARQIGEAVPQADPILNSYVSFVDQARVWLEAQTSGAAQN